MKLKNYNIINLINNGLLQTTEHDVPAEDAYKSYKFRKAVKKAYEAIAEKEKELAQTAGVEEGKEATEEQLKRIGELRVELYNDESELDVIPMSWAGFHALANENKKTPVRIPTGEKDENDNPKFITQNIDIFRAFEDVLEGVLFKSPEE